MDEQAMDEHEFRVRLRRELAAEPEPSIGALVRRARQRGERRLVRRRLTGVTSAAAVLGVAGTAYAITPNRGVERVASGPAIKVKPRPATSHPSTSSAPASGVSAQDVARELGELLPMVLPAGAKTDVKVTTSGLVQAQLMWDDGPGKVEVQVWLDSVDPARGGGIKSAPQLYECTTPTLNGSKGPDWVGCHTLADGTPVADSKYTFPTGGALAAGVSYPVAPNIVLHLEYANGTIDFQPNGNDHPTVTQPGLPLSFAQAEQILSDPRWVPIANRFANLAPAH